MAWSKQTKQIETIENLQKILADFSASHSADPESSHSADPERISCVLAGIRDHLRELVILAGQAPDDGDGIPAHTPDLTAENIRMVGSILPHCLTETQDGDGNPKAAIDFGLLKQALSDAIVEDKQERYELNWPGKRQALLTGCRPVAKTLRPDREGSVDFDNTQNLFIEGDNLDALKLMLESYRGQVKMIYIDPPYNTGNDRIYRDNFAESTEDYLENSNQTNGEGERLSSNTEANGRFHSDWLSMMYPRLEMARRLLSDDGVIFISCDDREVHNLRKLSDLVFGDENYVETYSWIKTSTPPSLSPKSRQTVEYVLCYEKNKNGIKYRGSSLNSEDQPLLNKGNPKRTLKFPKEKVFFSFKSDGALNSGGRERAKLINDLNITDGYSDVDIHLEGEFKWQQSFLDGEIEKGTTFIIKSDKFAIRFLRSTGGFKAPTNRIKDDIILKTLENCGTNESGSKEIASLFGENIFSNPKPTTLIQYLVNFMHLSENDIVLDFFAGSGTTAHAVMQLNAEDGGNRKCISVQIPEKIEVDDNNQKTAYDFCMEHGFKPTIAEISKERIRRAGEKILKGTCHEDWDKDIGFRVLKIDSTNFVDLKRTPAETTQEFIATAVNNIKPDRTNPEDLLFEVMIRLGLPLSLPIEAKTEHDKTIHYVGGKALVACFDQALPEALIQDLIAFAPERIAFRDHSFAANQDRINMTFQFAEFSSATIIKVV